MTSPKRNQVMLGLKNINFGRISRSTAFRLGMSFTCPDRRAFHLIIYVGLWLDLSSNFTTGRGTAEEYDNHINFIHTIFPTAFDLGWRSRRTACLRHDESSKILAACGHYRTRNSERMSLMDLECMQNETKWKPVLLQQLSYSIWHPSIAWDHWPKHRGVANFIFLWPNVILDSMVPLPLLESHQHHALLHSSPFEWHSTVSKSTYWQITAPAGYQIPHNFTPFIGVEDADYHWLSFTHKWWDGLI